MTDMFFSTQEGTTDKEAVEDLKNIAEDTGIDPEDVTTRLEVYPGAGTVAVWGAPGNLALLKTEANHQDIPVTATRLEYTPQEASEVEEIFDDLYFSFADERKE